MFPTPGGDGGEAPTLLDPSETANEWGYVFLTDSTQHVSPTPSPEDGKISSLRNVAFSVF
jgi:hypothetical protein